MKKNRARNFLLWALLVFITVPAHVINAMHNAPQAQTSFMQSVLRQYANVKKCVGKHRMAIIKGTLGVSTAIGGYYAYQYLHSLINDLNNNGSKTPEQQPDEQPHNQTVVQSAAQHNGQPSVAGMSTIASVVNGVDMAVLRHAGEVTCLRWHNGILMGANARDERSVSFWDLETLHQVERPTDVIHYINRPWPPSAMRFRATNQASRQNDRGSLYIDRMQDEPRNIMWSSIDLPNPTISHVLTGHIGAITALTFSAIKSLFASCSEDGELRIWNFDNMNNIRCVCVRRLHNNQGEPLNLQSLRFSADSISLAVGSTQGVVYVMNVQELLQRFSLSHDIVVDRDLEPINN